MKKFLKRVCLNISSMCTAIKGDHNIKLIYYHDVVNSEGTSYDKITIDKFKRQMEFLKENGYETLTFKQLDNIGNIADSVKSKMVLITFDDGYRSNYEIVFPIMRELDLKFNVFLEVGAINYNENYLTWDMVKKMQESNIVEFGAHTFNHVDARFIDANNADLEIVQANMKIKDETGIKVVDFCFPYGAYDSSIIETINRLNVYRRVYTSDGKRMIKYGDMTIIGRIGIENEDTEEIFKRKLKGYYNLYYITIRILKGLTKKGKEQHVRKHSI